MWLYLPSLTSPGSRAAEDSTSPSESCFRALSVSAWWRSKRRPWKFWRLAWKKGRLRKLQSTVTLEPGRAASIAAEWISRFSGRLVSPTRQPGNGSENPTSGTSGGISSEPLTSASPPWSSLKMSPGCFDFIDQSESDYRSWVTSLRDCYRRRRKSALLTSGSGSSCWRTPDAPGAGGPRNRQESMGEGHQTTVAEQAEQWEVQPCSANEGVIESSRNGAKQSPTNLLYGTAHVAGFQVDSLKSTGAWQTPGTDSFRSRGQNRKDEMGLDQQARNWQSPQSRDYRSGLIEPETAAKHVGSRPLNEEVLNWPTARSNDNRESDQPVTRRGKMEPQHLPAAAKNWPSPRSEDSESCGNHPNAMDSLRGAVGNWKTPHGAMGQEANGDYGSGGEFAKQAVNWSTPSTEDMKTDGPKAEGRYGTDQEKTTDRRLRTEVRAFSLPSSSLHTALEHGKNGKPCLAPTGGSGLRWVHSTSSIIPYDGLVYSLWAWRPIPCLRRKKGKRVSQPKSGKPFVRPAFRRRLNVFFDLWLMGWPLHWACRESIACGQSATESYLRLRRWHLSCSLNSYRSGNGMENSLESVDFFGRDETERNGTADESR